jgi:hypothetical protein
VAPVAPQRGVANARVSKREATSGDLARDDQQSRN